MPLPSTATTTIVPQGLLRLQACGGGGRCRRRWYSTEWAEPAPSHPTTRKWTFDEVIDHLALQDQQDKKKAYRVLPIAMKKKMAETTLPKEIYLVDVREKNELVKTGKIPGALNIPMSRAVEGRGCWRVSDEAFKATYGISRPPKGSHVVFYCRAGVRAHAAAAIAAEAGWRSIGEYSGSWLEWIKEGGPSERVFSDVKDATTKRWRPLLRDGALDDSALMEAEADGGGETGEKDKMEENEMKDSESKHKGG
ncbi:hypothetical protein L249_4312 [Ophiocordyceps polyrhachis-furcata BCC 54312]|uniref:Rhodanese domain-containing protein n=1 Tax=Ophiocordyceps polyrhachis-furcata BCC 54312 TaxID=1330021 RepID=A0A367L7W8_9HYPO|nr:hypothetical protein L249_4312 [Ophiocordyceps polyrhachis-furcata BCC 54312]